MVKAPVLEANNVWKAFQGTEGEIEVLKGLNLTAFPGEVVVIFGSSGVGKSTLLNILGTLDIPDRGTIELKGREVSLYKGGELNRLRNEVIGFVFQFHHLLPDFTAFENVMMPSLVGKKANAGSEEKARMLLEEVGLSNRMSHKPGELSGGEQQRVAVARAFANDPDLILADEPTGNLDDNASAELSRLILRLARQEGKAFVVVTHKKEFTKFASRAFLMEDGRLNEVNI